MIAGETTKVKMRKQSARESELGKKSVYAEVVGNLKIAGAQFNVTSVC